MLAAAEFSVTETRVAGNIRGVSSSAKDAAVGIAGVPACDVKTGVCGGELNAGACVRANSTCASVKVTPDAEGNRYKNISQTNNSQGRMQCDELNNSKVDM